MEQHKVDSTRGKAFSNPETYKRDVPMQVWLQSRHLATLMKWIETQDHGYLVRFRSDILKIVVEQLVLHLVESGAVEMVDTAQSAHGILEGRFGIPCNPQDKGKRNRIHNFELDSRRYERAGGYAQPEGSPTPPQYSTFESYKNVDDVKKEVVHTERGKKYSREEILAIRAEHEALMKIEEKKEIDKDLADVMANADVSVCPDTGRKIITPRGVPKSVVTEDVYKKHLMEEAERDAKFKEEEKEKKVQNKLLKKREKLLAELEEIDEVIIEKEDDDTPYERTYDEIVEDRMEKDRIQEDKLKLENDPYVDRR